MFEPLNVKDFKINPFSLKTKWMLVSSEYENKVNTMTASWGGFGVMWNKNVVYVVIRPQRYTKEFVDKSDELTLSFFDDTFKPDLSYLGKVSGKDEDKISKSNLDITHVEGFPTFAQSSFMIAANVLFK